MQDQIEAFYSAERLPADVLFQIGLVVEEPGINVVNHACEDSGAHEFSVSASSGEESLPLKVTDGWRPFDPPHHAPEPVLEASLEDRPVSGLGVHPVRTITDEPRCRREDDRCRLTAMKRRPQ